MEYWSYGVLERTGNSTDYLTIFPLLHYSATPFLKFLVLRRQRSRLRRCFIRAEKFNESFNCNPNCNDENN